ncbi:MAG: hypothetical protein EBS60_09145, partial [Verrucomicrobia bacterium]|nr:hypothetical protein [Verrucomicrobiota bacterium]
RESDSTALGHGQRSREKEIMSHHEDVSKEPESRFNAVRSRAFVASISVAIIFWGSLAVIIYLLLTK